MRYSKNKDINRLVRRLIIEGWFYERRKKHGVVLTPCKSKSVLVNGSPSCCRAFVKFKQDIKKSNSLIDRPMKNLL